MSLSNSLLCASNDNSGEACGHCNSCQLTRAGTHPDLRILEPEDESKAIKVGDVRGLCQEFCLTSQFGGFKLAVINHADNMNINASNSLLKTLEEPNDQTILILVSSRPHRLPITIRSRCQTVSFQTPETKVAEQWLLENAVENPQPLLDISYGAPLLARQYADSDLIEQRQELVAALLAVARKQPVVGHAEMLSKWPSQSLLGWIYDWMTDLLKLIQYGQNCHLVNQDYRKELLELSQKLQAVHIYHYLDQIIKLRKVQSIPLNSQLLWEDLLISWEQLLKRA